MGRVTIETHTEAILRAAGLDRPFLNKTDSRYRQAILAACQALHDEGVRVGIEAAAKVCTRYREVLAKGWDDAEAADELAIAIRAIDVAKLGEG